MNTDKISIGNKSQPSSLGGVMRSCIHCGNNDQSKFDVWEELDYNDGADEPHTGGNYLVNVEYGTCLVCGENL